MADENDIFRAASPYAVALNNLGFLDDLPGKWMGDGFNLIARPARGGVPTNPPFFLEINATRETLEFFSVGGDIPNRGDLEPTALLHGVRYLQTVVDCEDNSGLHVEPGFWLHVPKTAESAADTYVRQATIPHGDSLIAQSNVALRVAGGPTIDPVDTFPFPIDPAHPLQIPPLNDVTHVTLTGPYVEPFLTTPLPAKCLPAGLDAAKTIKDPTELLRAAVKSQTITETVVLGISTAGLQFGGIVNIPFVARNANVPQMDAIFWIEKVQREFPHASYAREFLQLQYVQRVILDFDGIHWPHVSVATLVKTL